MILNIVSHQGNLNWKYIYLNPVRMAAFKETNNKDVEKQEPFHSASGYFKVYWHSGGFSKMWK